MHNANYTKEINSNEEIFQLEIKSKFHQRGSFHQDTGFPVPFNECIYQLLNEY
jgi:hypothetical protein